MSVLRSTPTTRMRELAERLRELRLSAGLTVETVAESLLVSPSKISRLETAVRRPSTRDVRDLCRLYGISQDEQERLMALATQALETSWYQDADVDAVYRTFIGLEVAASDIETYQMFVIPGLLQTEAYARALLAGLRPPGSLSPERIEDVVTSRMRRQNLLDSPTPPRLHAIFDEVALTRPVGGAPVMKEQLARLLTAAEQPHVTLHVIPSTVGSHPGLDGRFTVLRFANRALRDTVYIEGLLGELFLDKESDVARYQEIFEYLASSVALDERKTKERITRLHASL